MRPFYSKDGRMIEPRDHIADFTGKNNSCKGKVLIYLLHVKGKYLTARQLHDTTGVSYDYLKGRLSFWFNIRYVNRKVLAPAKGKPAWAYCIAERGELFVNYRIPQDKRNEFIQEINDWNESKRRADIENTG